MDAQLKKGSIELCILQIIYKEDIYGYEIVQRLNVYFDEVTESAYYAILRRLSKNAYIESYLVDGPNGPKRKYYRITADGKRHLENLISDWNQINKILKKEGIDIIGSSHN